MIKKLLTISLFCLFMMFSYPAYSNDIPIKSIEKYTEKISKKFSKTYCNTIQFGISNEGAIKFAIGETNKEFSNNKLNNLINYDNLYENIIKRVGNSCQVYDLPFEELANLSFSK